MFNFARFAADFRVPLIGAGRGLHHHVRDGWLGTKCPLCGGTHLGYNEQKGFFHCWRCGPVKALVAIQALARCAPGRAAEVLREYDDGVGRRPQRAPKARGRAAPLPPGLGPLLSQHVNYLRRRGFCASKIYEIAEEWGLVGTGPLSGAWAWRVVAPIRNARGRIVAYVGRSIAERKDKYKMTPEAQCVEDPRGFLYGIDKVLGKRVLVVEGPADVWNIGPGAVATLGQGWHREQLYKLQAYEWRGVMFDPEPEAQKRARALADALALFPGETEVIDGLPSDPGGLPAADVQEIRKELLRA